MKVSKSITLNDIAAKLNVSKVTVSKALRDHPDISESRINEIKKIAAELGYIPNLAARNLSAKKTNTIGVIIPAISNSFFANMTESIFNCAFKKNYDIILSVSQEESLKERKHLETMLAMRVDGIIISVVEHSENKDMFERIQNSGIPIVFFDRTIDDSKFSSVTLANKMGSFAAVQRAIDNGYTKIGHIAGWQDSNIGKDRYLGYKEALQKNNLKLDDDLVIFTGFGKQSGYEAFMKMYDDNNLPEILFAVTFPVALGVIEAANDVGIKIPADLDIICFGDSELNEYLNPSITCVSHNTAIFAKQAFNLILMQIESNERMLNDQLEIETELLLKETCIKKREMK